MTWRSVAVYYAIAAVLGSYLWITHTRRTPVTEDAQTTTTPIVEALSSRVDAVVVEAAGVRAAVRRGEDGRWETIEPAGVALTSDLIEALLDTLTTIPPIEILGADGETALAQFGLAPAEITLRIASKDQVIAKLSVGKRNPTRTAVYAAREGADGVFLLGLNARYYIELILDELGTQIDAPPAA